MAGYKETPRQKMIAMMYLVLTALLALNVSREILSAFLVVNESMETTTEQFSLKVDEIFTDFEAQYTINPKKVGKYWEQAQTARSLSDSLVNYIEGLKAKVISLTEGISIEEADTISLYNINKKDNFDRPTNFFIGSDTKKGEATNLLDSITTYKEKMIKLVDEDDRAGFDLGLKTDGDYRNADGKSQPWARHHFYHTILAADLAILNKFIAEIYNAEANVINYLYSSISAEDFKFDEVSAKVIASSNYIFQGDDYRAEIIVAAYDSKQHPDIYVLEGADTLPHGKINLAKKIETDKGKGILILPQSTEGTKKYAGIVQIKNPWGVPTNYHFKSEFIVAKPSATISATKMNVFYRGVDNPVSISASGKADAQIRPDITSGRIVRTDQGWVVRNIPPEAYETTIRIFAEDNGGRKFMGEQLFRVKRLPDPIAKVIGISDGKISTKKMLANPFLLCQLPEGVDFEYDFKVTSFTMFIPQGGGYFSTEKAENQMFSQKMVDQIQNLKKNDVILFQDIKVRGPEGPRKIESINITIN
ncbi:MAG: gliding motility protein GldM [Bacteroidetes bacterium]|nr:gliding motility protein GldM [Bacteroidota bacterium]MBL7103483.1 gliding motility protein GldM [Bacteroidales bacterium]